MGIGYNPRIVTDGLILCLDAVNIKSYPGTGTTWYDISGKNNHFTINASAFNSTSKYMDFRGTYGCAKKTDSDLLVSGNVTVICWTRLLDSTTNWRTLLRGLSPSADHQVIVQSGGHLLGYYDNDTGGNGFNSSGYSVTSLPGYATQFNMMTWRYSTSSPYYTFTYNDTPQTIRGSITAANAQFQGGICSIGAYNNGDRANVMSASQFWGDITKIEIYNRVLTDVEIKQNFFANRGRYGI